VSTSLLSFAPVAQAVAELFAPHVEVVLHDAASGQIAFIANAFSKRKAGDESLIGNEPALVDADPLSGVYAKANWNGHRLRSISVRLTGEAGQLLGFLCINHDIEALSAAQEALHMLLAFKAVAAPPQRLFAQDWREEVNGVVAAFLRDNSLTLDGMTNGDQDAVLLALDQRGLFEVRRAPPYVASIFGWSRQTLYARLKRARGGGIFIHPTRKELTA